MRYVPLWVGDVELGVASQEEVAAGVIDVTVEVEVDPTSGSSSTTSSHSRFSMADSCELPAIK